MISLDDIPIRPAAADKALHRPQPRLDLLRVPGLGRLLRWRWGRLVLQLLLLALALLMIYDGLTGPPLAAQNIATVTAWVHYRGVVMLALLLAGNLFCMSCPFTVPRTLALRLGRRGRRWPRALRNKWTAIAVLVLFFFVYEWLDLWASPWLTAWLIVAYFAASFVLEAAFDESPFCKYVCPLGTFNFAASTVSPLQIAVRSGETCRTCVGKECINGSARVLGCGTELFAPQISSNLDCTFCLDCARACPHDNVMLATRPPLRELTAANAWPRRWDLSIMLVLFTFIGLTNAFGMVPPFYALQAWLAERLGTRSEALLLAIVFGTLNVVLPIGLTLTAAATSRWLAGHAEPLRHSVARFVPALLPLGFATWLAHYGFHFATGALTLIPVLQNFVRDHGLWRGEPAWQLAAIMPAAWIYPLQLLVMLAGLFFSLNVADQIGRRDFGRGRAAQRALLPWAVLLIGLTLVTLLLFNLPMEMRGTPYFGG